MSDGYRGSSSAQASAYKKQGHADEITFSRLIGGVVKTEDHTGKTDVIGPDNKTYTVKGAQKKWQIFLYGYERLKTDEDFKNMDGIGQLFLASLDCFPVEYEKYHQDKKVCKQILASYVSKNPEQKALKDEDKLSELIPEGNDYFGSKLRLKEVTGNLKKKLLDEKNLRLFLDKAIFNLAEVDRIAIKKNAIFLVFEKNDVLDILSQSFTIENSSAGNRKTDLNVDGQKILMTYDTNVVEIEIRNDSVKHYRQLRFNMLKDKALALLESKTKVVEDLHGAVFFLVKTESP